VAFLKGQVDASNGMDFRDLTDIWTY